MNARERKSKVEIINNQRGINLEANDDLIPANLKEVMEANVSDKSITIFDFETTKNGRIQNILSNYSMYLMNPEFLHKIVYNNSQARLLEYNPQAIALTLYGDINMTWAITFLNDMVKHGGDLSSELLTNGVVAFNMNGMEALKTLIKFKETNEQNAGIGNCDSLFDLDAE